jgi:hypothetical protein
VPFDRIVPPPGWRARTPSERFAAAVRRQRERNAGQEREIRLPFRVAPDHRLEGCPPSGAFKLTPEPGGVDDSTADR